MPACPIAYPSALDAVAAQLLIQAQRIRELSGPLRASNPSFQTRRDLRRWLRKRERDRYLRMVCALDRDLLLRGWSGPPADVLERIVASLGLTVVDGPITDVGCEYDAGVITFQTRTIQLHVTAERFRSGTNIPGYRNSTLAHELGHWRLHRANIGELPYGRREHQAYVYAEEFLVPEEMLLAHPLIQRLRSAAHDPPDEELWADLASVASDFRVTRSLIIKRLVDLTVLCRDGRHVTLSRFREGWASREGHERLSTVGETIRFAKGGH